MTEASNEKFPEDEMFPLESETPGQSPQPKPGLITSKNYDLLKRVVQVLLPGAGALYFALAQLWGLPAAEQVVGTVAAVSVFLGLFLQMSNRAYKNDDNRFDGDLVVDETDPLKDKMTLEISTPLQDLSGKDEITLKVRNVE